MRGPVREGARNGRSGGIIFDTKQIFPNGPLPKPEPMTETSDWK